MDTVIKRTGWPRAATVYWYSIIICGAAALVSAPMWLPMPHFDLRFLLLVGVTVLVSSRFAVQIPRVNTNVTVSDTFIFLVLLLYGGFAGIMNRRVSLALLAKALSLDLDHLSCRGRGCSRHSQLIREGWLYSFHSGRASHRDHLFHLSQISGRD